MCLLGKRTLSNLCYICMSIWKFIGWKRSVDQLLGTTEVESGMGRGGDADLY